MTEPAVPIVFLDTETDGVHPDRKVWEVAMIRRDGSGEHETSFFVEIDLSTADPFGLRVGRFYERHPYGRYLSGRTPGPFVEGDEFLRLRDAAEMVARTTHGAHLVGMVPNFDAEVLGGLLRSRGLAPAWHYHLIDAETLAVGHLLSQGRGDECGLPWDSEAVSRACGVEPPGDEERHTALGDARWAARLYDAVVAA